MKKKMVSVLLAAAMGTTALVGFGSTAYAADDVLEFYHGYYQDESEWAAAQVMRDIYDGFAEAHADGPVTFKPIAVENRDDIVSAQVAGGSFPDMVFRMPEDHIDQKHHPHRRAEHFFIMEHIQIPHSHRKLLSRKDVFQDSVIHYLLIYQVLAAEDIQCNDQHICHHHQQIAVFIHENI